MPITTGDYVRYTDATGQPEGQVGLVCCDLGVSCCVQFPAGCLQAFKIGLIKVPQPVGAALTCTPDCTAGNCAA